MSLLAALRVALAAVLVHKGRSALTSLGIVIGIAAVIGLVAAGDGARRKLDQQLEGAGKDLLLVRAGATTAAGSLADLAPLRSEDAPLLRRRLGERLAGVADLQITQRPVVARTAAWTTMIVGCPPDMQTVRRWPVSAGRFLDHADLRRQAQVCLLGQTVRRRLFDAHADPLGQTVRVDGVPLRVVGLLAPKGRSITGADQDDQVFVPLTTLQRRIAGQERVTVLLVAPRDPADGPALKNEIGRLLREGHRVKPGGEDFDVATVAEMAAIAVVVTRTMRLLIAAIAAVSLLVGGIGIMNIMLVSVTERTREIGLRVAVGARPADVLTQFLLEAVVLALFGGLLGVVLGLAGAAGLARLASWPLVVSPALVALAFAVCAAVGVFFGFYPAWKAARLDPIEALRHE